MSTLEQRLWRRVIQLPNGCWIWTGATNQYGYGVIGRGQRGQGNTLTHRVAYELAYGPIPADRPHLDHSCRVERCCNPTHLEPVTQAENNRREWAVIRSDKCPRGHRFTADNTYRIPSTGHRLCRSCNNERGRTAA